MNNQETTSATYPIGKFVAPTVFSNETRNQWIEDMRNFPLLLRRATEHLSDAQLKQTYREGGWNIRQIVHHCADSHLNAYVRTKLMLTEDQPTVKPYDENFWAAMNDYSMPILSSLQLLEALHTRWVFVLENASEVDFQKTYYHPQYQKTVMLNELMALYAWHGMHHLGQITTLLAKEKE
ncbi:MAG: putative metal-dependent hydrolase [Bacteroidetes bacterium]|nr:putative metal-dependent hydrolase [Bacteroidota bacterium]